MNNKQKIYFFSQLQTDGDQNMVDVLGGKGANIAEMCKLGIPVPPGFTLATSLCSEYLKTKSLSASLKKNIKKNIPSFLIHRIRFAQTSRSKKSYPYYKR